LRTSWRATTGTASGGWSCWSAWIEGRRRRLAEEPVEGDVPRKQQRAWRPGIEDVLKAVGQAFGVERQGVVASRRHGNCRAVGSDLPGASGDA
jgi:hypothetical protein